MAPTFACVFALLVSQVTVVSAASSPFNDPANANTLACQAHAAGCTCAGVGQMDNASLSASNCSGSIANGNNCMNKCCGDAAVATCGGVLSKNSSLCGATMTPDYAKLSNAAGATAAVPANCCKAKVTATCAAVTCNVVVGERGHGKEAVIYKAKVGVALTTACTSIDDCETKCCERNQMTCAGNIDPNTQCGVNHTMKAMTAAGVYPKCSNSDRTLTAAYSATFTDNATYKAACCDLRPAVVAVVYAKCAATPVCPTHYQAKSPVPTTNCSGATCTTSECCDLQAGVTNCLANCTGNMMSFATPKSNECGETNTYYCASVRCASGLFADYFKMIANATTVTDAAFSTACCIAGPPATPAAAPNAKCSAYFTAAAAGKAAAEGSLNAAHMQGGSLSILAVAVLMAMKLGV